MNGARTRSQRNDATRGAPGRRVQQAHFDTARLPQQERLEAWRGILAPQVRVTPARDTAGEFAATVDAWRLGDCDLGVSRFTAQTGIRDRRLVSQHALECYNVLVPLQGIIDTETEGQRIRLHPGDVMLEDTRRTKQSFYHGGALLLLRIPRYRLAGITTRVDLHAHVLRAGMAQTSLLREHLIALHEECPALHEHDIPAVVHATATLVAAAVAPADPETAQPLSLKERVERHIHAHLSDPALDAVKLQRRFNLSRTRLYELFRGDGGISKYIRVRRLDQAASWLTDPTRATHTIQQIAFEAGFRNERQFQRAFRQRFGVTAQAIRNAPAEHIRELSSAPSLADEVARNTP